MRSWYQVIFVWFRSILIRLGLLYDYFDLSFWLSAPISVFTSPNKLRKCVLVCIYAYDTSEWFVNWMSCKNNLQLFCNELSKPFSILWTDWCLLNLIVFANKNHPHIERVLRLKDIIWPISIKDNWFPFMPSLTMQM